MLAHLTASVLFLAIGAVLGLLGGMFGIGGGLIGIPLLGLVFGFSEQLAQGTVLVMVAANVLAGVRGYARQPAFDLRAGAILACAAIPFSFLGAFVAVHMNGSVLRYGFATLLCVLGIWFAAGALMRPSATVRAPWPQWGVGVMGAVGGGLSGVFTVGGAVVAVPFLSTFFGYSQATAQGLALAMVAPGALISIATYAFAHDVDWWVGIPLALGGTFLVPYGIRIAYRLPDATLRLLFSVLLLASSAALMFKH
jgi:uncharacterized protein